MGSKCASVYTISLLLGIKQYIYIVKKTQALYSCWIVIPAKRKGKTSKNETKKKSPGVEIFVLTRKGEWGKYRVPCPLSRRSSLGVFFVFCFFLFLQVIASESKVVGSLANARHPDIRLFTKEANSTSV